MRTTSPRRAFRTTALAATAVLAVAGLSSCRTPPKTLAVTTVLSGVHRPWDLAFTPGGQLLFTERGGPVKIRLSSGTVRTLADPSDVVAQSEGGMMGLAVDPGFSTNRRVYTCFLSNKGGALDVRLVRWKVNAGTTGLEARTDIVTGLPVNTNGEAGRHSGCRPRFGPDGNLWVGTGDAATAGNPQSPTSLGGKVLRVNTDGAGVSGNMTSPFDHRIFSYGHRNVQGIAFSNGGAAYSIEHGTGRDDEVNKLVAKANYGWDPRPPSGSFYDESQPMTNLAKYPDARKAVWTSGDPTIAPSGGTFLRGDKWVGWENSLAMAVLKGQHLRILAFDKNGTAVQQQWVRVTDQGRIRVAVQGPDGNLYLATDADPGKVLKVTPSS